MEEINWKTIVGIVCTKVTMIKITGIEAMHSESRYVTKQSVFEYYYKLGKKNSTLQYSPLFEDHRILRVDE